MLEYGWRIHSDDDVYKWWEGKSEMVIFFQTGTEKTPQISSDQRYPNAHAWKIEYRWLNKIYMHQIKLYIKIFMQISDVLMMIKIFECWNLMIEWMQSLSPTNRRLFSKLRFADQRRWSLVEESKFIRDKQVHPFNHQISTFKYFYHHQNITYLHENFYI
jgi:hypothetical protein